MARRVALCTADEVRRLIAHSVLEDERIAAQLGSVRLRAHQRNAVARIQRALRRVGGALLADSVGLGKTYVALATAREFGTVLVIAPAVLRRTWIESAARARVGIRFVSTESLSRITFVQAAAGLVIVDEAHHFRNPRTRRYARLAQLTTIAPVLLLTATPVHNRRADLSALLALFLGSAAESPSPVELARCVIRREHCDTRLRLPALSRLQRVEIDANEAVALAILALPPAVPPRDGGEAGRLVTLGLLHMWTSSDAAAVSGVRRRLAAGASMRACLVEGRTPSRGELRSWLAGDATVQLGFTELLVEPSSGADPDVLAALDAHIAALRALLQLMRAGEDRDRRRASELRKLRSCHRNDRMLAFASYAETVHAMFRKLVQDGQVAAATARGGRIASGRTTREEVLRMFRTPDHAREEVKLLLATDLLSEGLNLPEASIVVHLDLPWTAARLEQRVGRARRPGNSSRVVRTYAFVQPTAIERLVGRERLIAHKARAAECIVGPMAHDEAEPERRVESPSRTTEKIRRILRKWRRGTRSAPGDARIGVAAVHAARAGFVALIRRRDGFTLIAGGGSEFPPGGSAGSGDCGRDLLTANDPRRVHAALAMAGGSESPVEPRAYLAARRAIARWLTTESARRSSGTRSTRPSELRSLLQRLDAAAALAPLHARAETAARVSRIREKLSGRLTRGLEIAITERARSKSDDARLIGELEALIADTSNPPGAIEDEPVAVLLLAAVDQVGGFTNAASADRPP